MIYALNFCPTNNGGTRATGVFQFSKFSRPAGGSYIFYDDYSYDTGYVIR